MPSLNLVRLGIRPLLSWVRCLCLLSLVGGLPALALDPAKKISQYGHEVWQQEQGLPQNAIWAIAQTPDGYLWFGTEEGLARFDGVTFTVFNKGNTPGILNNRIYSLLVDRQGTLWIGMGNGELCRRVKDRFEAFPVKDGLPKVVITCLLEDRDGSLWIGTGGGLAHLVNGAFHTYGAQDGLSSAGITALRQDHLGRLWVGTERGLNLFEGGRFQPTAMAELAGEWVVALCEDRDAGLWIGCQAGGIWRLQDGRIRRYGPEAGLPQLGFRALGLDRQGSLWIGSRKTGLVRHRNGRFETYSRAQGLSDEVVLSLFEDREGSLWVGTATGGLNRFRDTPFVTISTAEGLSASPSSVILEGRDGTLWAGAVGTGGLNRLKDGKVTHLGRQDGLANEVISALAEGPDGSLWIGTESGLDRLKAGKVQHYGKQQGLLGDLVLSLLTGSDGSLWIGTVRGGVNHLVDGRIASYTNTEGLLNDVVYCLLEGLDGGLWIGTGGGLARLQKGAITTPVTKDLSGGAVFCLLEEGDGSLWFGTDGGGLKRLKDGRLATLTTKQGLFNDTVFWILDDGLGNFWMSCTKGIFRAAKRELAEVAEGTRPTIHCVAYGIADGMRNAECMGGGQPVGWKTRDGKLWFPTTLGLAVVDPAHLVSNPLPPPVHIEAVLIDQEQTGPTAAALARTKAEGVAGLIHVPAGTKRLEIHYTALSFLIPERVRFEYRLEGFDPTWIQAGTRRTAYYTSLPPGTFRFQVRACNNDGVWNLDGASVSFKVAPHFYQTYWFYGLCGLLAVGLGSVIQRHFQKVRIHELEMKNRVLDERHRLARDVHDQLSQTMTGLLLQLEAGGHALLLGPDRCRPYLDRAVALARDGIAETRRTLKGFRATALDDGNLAQALEGTAQRLTLGTDVKVEVLQEGNPFALPGSVEDDLFRVGQEGITNALRHGHALRIEIRLEWGSDGVRLTIQDDGCGIASPQDPSVPSAGLGLSGMWERITTDKGTLKVGNRPEGGTVVEVFIPRQEMES